MPPWTILPFLTVALYYLGAHATITAFIHTRYPEWLRGFMECPACVGFWYGLFVGALWTFVTQLPFGGIPANSFYAPLAIALCAMVWTPLLASLHLRTMLWIPQIQKATVDFWETYQEAVAEDNRKTAQHDAVRSDDTAVVEHGEQCSCRDCAWAYRDGDDLAPEKKE
jgi:hypothetical protein